MKLSLARGRPLTKAHAIDGLFVARRAALKVIRARVLAGSGLTAEIAELLLELFEAAKDRETSAGGYLSCQDLLAAVDYSAGLLSRRLNWLCQRRWAEMKRAAADLEEGVHGNSRKVRITDAGKAKITPVWKKYVQQTDDLLAGVSASDLAAYARVNELIVTRVSPLPMRVVSSSRLVPKPVAAAPIAKPVESAPQPRNLIFQTDHEFLD
jgi:hypothetical protein